MQEFSDVHASRVEPDNVGTGHLLRPGHRSLGALGIRAGARVAEFAGLRSAGERCTIALMLTTLGQHVGCAGEVGFWYTAHLSKVA